MPALFPHAQVPITCAHDAEVIDLDTSTLETTTSAEPPPMSLLGTLSETPGRLVSVARRALVPTTPAPHGNPKPNPNANPNTDPNLTLTCVSLSSVDRSAVTPPLPRSVVKQTTSHLSIAITLTAREGQQTLVHIDDVMLRALAFDMSEDVPRTPKHVRVIPLHLGGGLIGYRIKLQHRMLGLVAASYTATVRTFDSEMKSVGKASVSALGLGVKARRV